MSSTMLRADYAALRDRRVADPGAIAAAAATRRRRPSLTGEDRLLIVAADHPARAALAVGGRVDAMADRYELLDRLLTCLANPRVDGVLGTADLVEDLLLLGGLDDRLVIGSMNRGGIAGSVFEFDDRFTGYTATALRESGMDGGKMLCRIDPDDPHTVDTLAACGQAVTELADGGLLAMIEPFWSGRDRAGKVVNDLSTAAVIKSVAVASGLGATSAHTWLKLPVVEHMSQVMAATTLPAVILGGDSAGSAEERIDSWGRALAVPGVRGLVVGRTLLYPDDDDVAGAVAAAADLLR